MQCDRETNEQKNLLQLTDKKMKRWYLEKLPATITCNLGRRLSNERTNRHSQLSIQRLCAINITNIDDIDLISSLSNLTLILNEEANFIWVEWKYIAIKFLSIYLH